MDQKIFIYLFLHKFLGKSVNIYDFCDFSLLNRHFCPIFEEVNFLAKNKDKFNFLTVDYLGKNLNFYGIGSKNIYLLIFT